MDSPDGIAGTDMTPDELRAGRYTRIRETLGKAQPMNNETYLLAQIALVMCDVYDALTEQGEILRLMCDEMREVRLNK